MAPTRNQVSPSDLLTQLNTASLADAAVRYASAGWPVLPLNPRDKTPLGRLVPNGLKNASTDLDVIEAWWATVPDANIGLRTGEAFDVLDLDGPDALSAFADHVPGYQHAGPVSYTGKGYHLLFSVTGGKNAAKMLDAPIDFRGQNGYIVAPPSIHPSGRVYGWQRGNLHDLPEPPEWLLDLVIPVTPQPTTQPSKQFYSLAERRVLDQPMRDVLLHLFPQLRQRGKHWTCPFHADSTPSLIIYENNTFFCFGCGAYGDNLNLYHYQRHGQLLYKGCAQCATETEAKPAKASTTEERFAKIAETVL